LQTAIKTGNDKDYISWDGKFNISDINHNFIHDIAFRPFDIRTIYYDPSRLDGARFQVGQHLINDSNFALAFTRQIRASNLDQITLAFITNMLIESHALDFTTYFAPLYLISKDGDKTIHTPNFTDDFKRFFKDRYNIDPSENGMPERILSYIYAILYSPSCLNKYIEFIKYNYPRVPFLDKDRFDKLADLGNKLINLHLMKEMPNLSIEPESDSDVDNTIGTVKFRDNRLYINKSTYLTVLNGDPITEEDLNFKVGTRKVLLNWLKSRKGRTLAPDDYDTIAYILYAIRETKRIMKDIDEVLTEDGELVI